MKPDLEKLARHRLARAKAAFAEGERLLRKSVYGRRESLLCRRPRIRGLLRSSHAPGGTRAGLIKA